MPKAQRPDVQLPELGVIDPVVDVVGVSIAVMVCLTQQVRNQVVPGPSVFPKWIVGAGF